MKPLPHLLRSILLCLSLTTLFASADTYTIASRFTTQIVKGEPVDDVVYVNTSFENIFYFSNVTNCNGCEVAHEWLLNGNHIDTSTQRIEHNQAQFWTIMPQHVTGNWTVRTFVNGDRISEANLQYYDATVVEQQQAPVQQRIQIRQISECEEQVHYFSQQHDEHPKDKYFAFMLDKWRSRCVVKD